MAAFSFQYHPFLVDSPFFSSAPIKMTGFTEQSQPPQFHESSLENCFVVDQSSKFNISDNEPSSVTKNQSPETSLVLDKLEPDGEQVTQKVTSMEKKKRNRINRSFSLTRPQSKDSTGARNKRQKKSNNGELKKGDKAKDENKNQKSREEPPTGYIHVRARRGQATDSHSLAERARREKISERMKMLQRLVPGCDKVTGKALMLDEIINYVQSLQNQVEFLSMKLASVNPMLYDFTVDLDSLTIRPEKSNCIPSPFPSVQQQCSSINQATTFVDTTTVTATTAAAGFPTANDYLLDNSASFFLQGQRSNVLSEDPASQFWDIEDPRQKFLHPYGINNSSLCFFH